jgi:hypothetical protein
VTFYYRPTVTEAFTSVQYIGRGRLVMGLLVLKTVEEWASLWLWPYGPPSVENSGVGIAIGGVGIAIDGRYCFTNLVSQKVICEIHINSVVILPRVPSEYNAHCFAPTL